jgi:hypothetical protein
MLALCGDEIVESRTWSSGVEIVARVNWSHVARIRRALGLAGENFASHEFTQLERPERRTRRRLVAWLGANRRAA